MIYSRIVTLITRLERIIIKKTPKIIEITSPPPNTNPVESSVSATGKTSPSSKAAIIHNPHSRYIYNILILSTFVSSLSHFTLFAFTPRFGITLFIIIIVRKFSWGLRDTFAIATVNERAKHGFAV